MTQLITYEGKTYSFTDDFTDEEISEALSSLPAEAAPAELALEPELPPVAPEPAEGLLDRAGELIEAGARNFAGSSASGVSSALEYFDAAQSRPVKRRRLHRSRHCRRPRVSVTLSPLRMNT